MSIRLRAVVLAALAVPLFAGCDAPAPATAGLDVETTRRLFEHLDRLVAALEARPSAATGSGLVANTPTTSATPDRTPADAPVAALEARVTALEAEIAQLRLHGPGAAIPRPTAARMKVTGRVDQLAAQLREENTRQAGRTTLFLLTPMQVLEMLGTPDETLFFKEGGFRWCYKNGESGLSVRFQDGLVMDVDA